MTEGDLNCIEKQIENLQVMHKVSEVEKELEELEQELHQLLPVSAALTQGHFSVNPKQVHGQAEDLPAWCSKISTLLKSMAILLATLGGKEIDILELLSPGYSPKGTKNVAAVQPDSATGFIGRSQSFSTKEDVEKEMKQFGVSVKNLKANYEIQSQPASSKETRVYKRQSSLPVVSKSKNSPESVCQDDPCSSVGSPQSHTNGSLPLQEEPVLKLVEEPVIGASHAPQTYAATEMIAPTKIEEFNQVLSADSFLNNHQLTRSLEVQTDLSYVQECIETRKERIVFLFLEHWRKYTISEAGRRGNNLDVSWENFSQANMEDGSVGQIHREDDKLLLFMKSKQVVGKLIGHWRTIMSQVPSRQIRRLSRAQMIYWPEHFLPHINGSPVSYESLTLDLFMLGYFQLLEMNMSRDERKFRHLLCYEMFDRLGRHQWEVIKQFHKEVMGEIERGTRDWPDGFEDIKLKYFGDSDDEGGVMTASLHSMSPEVAFIPVEEPLPPPPCHPPPLPPPNTHPPSPSQIDLPFVSPAAALDAALDTSQCGEQNSLLDSVNNSQMDLQNSEHVSLNEPNAQQDEIRSMQNTDTTKNAETLPCTAENKEEVPDEDVTVKTTTEAVDQTRGKDDSINVIYELKEFSNEEIIRYIDRSFAFWKEKEAELFDI
ncbi:espin-like protein [Syngnathus typhle]|uniref:espin-like protein n=1 Tax=Syngnathus typhle TaxID=161592 RepID=UPI002A6B3996|nr:espin-like protein [Syngnathus typhle]